MKLLLLTACDKVLQDPQFGSSLISVFHGIKFQVPAGTELPKDAVVPKEWAIFSKWELLPEEENKNHVSVIEIFWPDGNAFIKYALKAAQPTKNGMAFINRMTGFPVGQDGKLKVIQSLECDGVVVGGPHELDLQVDVTYAPVESEAEASDGDAAAIK
jgi:hypothetical protein